jgi:hypothetical protein
MKTKIILTFLFAITIFAVSSTCNFMYANNSQSSTTDKEEQIDIHGSLAQSTLRSSFTPFEVIKGTYSLSIYYLQDLTNISINVYNELGQSVYSNRVNPNYGSSLHLDISSWPKGITRYLLRVLPEMQFMVNLRYSLLIVR